MSQPTAGRSRRARRLRRLLRLGEHLFAVVGLVLVVYHCGFDLSRMVSGSMSPTLQSSGPDDGDWVLSEKLSYLVRAPRRWELVEFRNDEGLQIMKRVVGLPGEKLALDGQQVMVDGAATARPGSLADLKVPRLREPRPRTPGGLRRGLLPPGRRLAGLPGQPLRGAAPAGPHHRPPLARGLAAGEDRVREPVRGRNGMPRRGSRRRGGRLVLSSRLLAHRQRRGPACSSPCLPGC